MYTVYIIYVYIAYRYISLYIYTAHVFFISVHYRCMECMSITAWVCSEKVEDVGNALVNHLKKPGNIGLPTCRESEGRIHSYSCC